MSAPFRAVLLTVLISGWGVIPAVTQTATVIPANEAAQHVGQHVTVEGTVAKVFTSRNGNTFLNLGAAYPNELFTGWIPRDSALSADPALWSLRGRRVKLTGIVELYRGKPEIKFCQPISSFWSKHGALLLGSTSDPVFEYQGASRANPWRSA
jgi:hypothetical protein